jgi:hypothetical protein
MKKTAARMKKTAARMKNMAEHPVPPLTATPICCAALITALLLGNSDFWIFGTVLMGIEAIRRTKLFNPDKRGGHG